MLGRYWINLASSGRLRLPLPHPSWCHCAILSQLLWWKSPYLLHQRFSVPETARFGIHSQCTDYSHRFDTFLHHIYSDSPLTLDLQAKNFLLRIEDQTVLKDGEEVEIGHPSLRTITEQATIFETRDLLGPLCCWIGGKSRPILCDSGKAHMGKDSSTEHIQLAVYRAPEVFLHIPWGTPVDIWDFGCMVGSLMIITSSCSHPLIYLWSLIWVDISSHGKVCQMK